MANDGDYYFPLMRYFRYSMKCFRCDSQLQSYLSALISDLDLWIISPQFQEN